MKNRRQNILSASLKLFNKLGYSNVTIRMIALELKISSGNLNYHFKKREDILEALYFEMVSEFDVRIENLGETKFSLETIKKDIELSMHRMVEYQFFWTDLYILLRLNDKIRLHFEEVYKKRFKGYEILFNSLIEMNIMESFELTKESQFLIERMIGFSNTWLYNSFLYRKKNNQNYIETQSDNLLFMLYPYLTDFGKTEYKRLVPGCFV